jgi:Domain of unknown function (DUF6438)
MNSKFYIIILLVGMISCKVKKETLAETTSNNNDVKIFLSKDKCAGLCSRYNIYVLNNRAIRFEGFENVNRYGLYERILTKEEFSKIVTAYDASGFMTMKNQYSVDISDFPMITMSYSNGKTTKRIEGRTERPEELVNLQNQLEKLAYTGEWTLLKEYPKMETNDVTNNRYLKGDTIQNQFIIEPQENFAMGPWLRANQKYGLNLMKKLTQDGKLWLVSYNMDTISPERMLAILKSEEGLKTVQFNSVVTPRDH